MSDDLVERLRGLARSEHGDFTVGDEAAEEIELLRAERDALRADLNGLRETLPGGHVAYEQMVDLAIYVSEHAKGGMKARVDEFLSTEHAQCVARRHADFAALRARIDGAPVAKVRGSGRVGELAAIYVSHSLIGKRVALVVVE